MENVTLYADGFDEAVVGIDYICSPPRIIYDKNKMVEILMEEGMELDDAIEHLEYNVWCAYVGEGTPIYAHIGPKAEIDNLIEDYGL